MGQRAALVRDVFSTPARFVRRCRARHLIGVQVVAFVLMVGYSIRGLVAAIAVGCRKRWSRTVVRVAGSWIAAISLLTIGWLWQSEQPETGSEEASSLSEPSEE